MKQYIYYVLCCFFITTTLNAQTHCSFTVDNTSTLNIWNWQQQQFETWITGREGSSMLTSPFFWQGSKY